LSNTTESPCALPTSGKSIAHVTEKSQPSCERSLPDMTRSASSTNSPHATGRTARVYDILNVGKHNRFQAGRHIVHNCYGIGAPGIQNTLKSEGVSVSEEEAGGYLDAFASRYPAIISWMERVEASTMHDEFAMSLFGRRRRLEEVLSDDNSIVSRAMRQCVNHVIQSTAGDLTMTSLALFDQEVCLRQGTDPRLIMPTADTREFPVDERWKRVHPILQVHDMIGVDCHKDVAEDVVERLVHTMENVVDLAPIIWGPQVQKTLKPLKRVPIIAEPEVGPNWRDATKVKKASDVPLSMHISFAKQRKLDADPAYKWEEKDTQEAEASYGKAT